MTPAMRSAALLPIAVALSLCACGTTTTPASSTTPRKIAATPETVWVQPGATGTLTFKVTDEAGAPLPGALVTFTIVDDPATPGTEAQGATLATTSATTDTGGACAAHVTAGLLTVFRVRATSAGQTAEVVVVVAAGVVGTVDVAPFFPSPAGDGAAALSKSVEVLFFDNGSCRDLPLRAPPQPARTPQSVSAAGGVARYEFVSTSVANAVIGRALDANGVAQALGCTDLPGSALVAGGVVQAALPLVASGPDPTGDYDATTTLQIAPALAAAASIGATWSDLTACPLDPAQRWLDCTIDALGPATASDPLDCVPSSTPGGDGALGDALGALRGAILAGGPDGAPTACRGSKTASDAESVDAVVAGLFGSPLPAAFVHLAAAAEDAPHLFDELQLHSLLEVSAGATLTDVSVLHTLTSVTFVLPDAMSDVPLQPLGLPTLTVSTTGTAVDGTLTIAQHGFTARLGTAARVAFGTLGLGRRGLPTTSQALVAALAALAHTDDGTLVGCAALDEVLCARVGQATGCLVSACAAGLEALAQRLDGSFTAADGTDLDLYLSGTAPLLDTHGDGLADRLGDLQAGAQAGAWSVDLRPRGGRRVLAGSWEAIREGK
jgi:hypothetical protein